MLYKQLNSKLVLTNFKNLNTSIKRSKSYHLIVVGGGSGGLSVASKFKNLNKDRLAIVEPADKHYYQPLFTLVGGGVKNLNQTFKPMKDVIPSNADWIKNQVKQFNPDQNELILNDNTKLNYEYLVVAAGIELDFNRIKGFPDAFNYDNICSNYSPNYVEKTWLNIKNFKGGNAVFTFPNTPIKCAGAPQKIVYLADDYFRKIGIRDKTNLIFNSALAGIFAVPKYAKALNEVLKNKNVIANFRHNLIEVRPKDNEAVFENLDTNEKIVQKYDFLHVTPPQKAADNLKPLADQTGFVDVDKFTLQHKKYSNIFAIGDCSNLPTSKTAAAIAGQCNIVYNNLNNVINKKGTNLKYDGYTSCPLVTSRNTCIMAEFDYDLNPRETFPIDQSKERKTMYFVKKEILPFIYWNLMLNGNWNGPKTYRKLMRLGRD